MPTSSMYADTSRLAKPWRPQSLYANLPLIAGQAMQSEDEDDPVRKMLMQMGAGRIEAGANAPSTRSQELQTRIAGSQTGSQPTTSKLRSMIPTEASAALQGNSNQGFSANWMNQLNEIGKQGQLATDRQRAIAAYKAAQAAAAAKANAGGGGGFDFNFSGDVSKARQNAIRFAKGQLGVPYVWGGESPGRGFDCSGLVQWAYGKAGIRLPRVSQDQMTRGRRTAIRNLVPGDLVGVGFPAHHIGIWLGGGRIVVAPHTGANVRIQNIGNGSGWWGIHLNI